MFQVETDQLKVSNGWVRCGQCDGVFDASAHFQLTPEIPVAELQDNQDRQDDLDPAPEAAPQPLAIESLPEAAAANEPLRAEAAAESPASAALSSYLSAPEVQDEPQNMPAPAEPSDSDARLALYGREPKSSQIEESRRKAEVSFVQAARRRARRTRPLYRALVVLTALGLLLTFLVQVLLQQRNDLAARYPVLLPALQTLCQPLNCEVSPPRVIEAIAIDSSSFTQVGPDSYRLNFVLQNKQTSAVAMPALEVTLTGLDDNALLSKIVLPAEYGATSVWLHSGSTFTGAFNLRAVAPAASAATQTADPAGVASLANTPPEAEKAPALLSITGYRLLAFYP